MTHALQLWATARNDLGLNKRRYRRLVRDRVEFIPRVPQLKLFELYDTHDLLLFPSLHDSGGYVVLEALSHGLPVVCLDLGGPNEIVTSQFWCCRQH